MATVQITQYFVMDLDGRSVKGGSLSEPRCITLGDDEVSDQTFQIAPAASVKIWDKTENESLGNLDLLWLESDFDVLVQFTTDAGTTDSYDVKKLKGSGTANEPGPALVLGSDDTQLPGTIDTFVGTADTIDEIWVHNESATNTARVRLVAAT